MATLMFASLLSHASAATLIVLALWLFLVARRRRRLIAWHLSGVALGFAFAIRPLTALAFAIPFGIFVLLQCFATDEWRKQARGVASLVAGGVFGSLPVFVANYCITGAATTFVYSSAGGVKLSLANLGVALFYMDETLAYALPSVFGWGWKIASGWVALAPALGFALVPLFLPDRKSRYDLLLLSAFVSIPLAYLTHSEHGMHGYGARFYFEGFFCLYLLTARGFYRLGKTSASGWESANSFPLVAVVAAGLFLVLSISAIVTLPRRLVLYRGYNGVSTNLEDAVAAAGIRRGLILLDGASWYDWGKAANLMSSDLQGPIAVAASGPDNTRLLSFYADRPVYEWRNGSLNFKRGAGPAQQAIDR